MTNIDGDNNIIYECIMLCGGIGSRLNQDMFPKPLTNIYGIPLLHRSLEYILPHVNNITFIANPLLKCYQFEAIINKIVKGFNVEVKVWYLPFDTRGALESLYLYLNTYNDKNIEMPKKIIILDNDNLYDLRQDIFKSNESGIIYINMKSDSILTHYSFIKHLEGKVNDIVEKNRISNYICVGYILTDIVARFNDMKILLTNPSSNNEYYLSLLYQKMLKDNISIAAIESETIILGTIDDIKTVDYKDIKNDIRRTVVFDIDNTLINTSKEEIREQISFLNYLHSNGWYIILYTARGMKSRNNKLNDIDYKIIHDQVVNDIRLYNIPYDELVLGKPYGDIYIDDKAYNPYDDKFFTRLGFFSLMKQNYTLRNSSLSNTITRTSYKTIVKQSLTSLSGEIGFYNLISKSDLSIYFPEMKYNESNYIELEYIPGPTFSNLYLEELLSESLFIKLLNIVDTIHTHSSIDSITLTSEDISIFYMEKLVDRYMKLIEIEDEIYHPVISKIYTDITDKIKSYTCNEITNIIHGDLWFRNIIVYNSSIKLIDMRGKIGNIITVKGDKLYDYAKLYQSLIGMDYYLNNIFTIPDSMIRLRNIFETRYKDYMVDIITLTRYTIFCSLVSWEKIERYNLLKLLNS